MLPSRSLLAVPVAAFAMRALLAALATVAGAAVPVRAGGAGGAGDSGTWTSLGGGKSSTSGLPLLHGSGPLTANSSNQVSLADANPFSPTTLVFGPALLAAPFKGGILVPEPLVLIPLTADAGGGAIVPFTLPPGVGPGLSLYFQFWIHDPGASLGLAASNGLLGTTS